MNNSHKTLFLISFTIFITVLIWILVDIYHINKNRQYEVDYRKSMQMEIRHLDKNQVKKILNRK